MSSALRGLVSVLAVPLTASLIYKASIRFVAPVYGQFVASQNALLYTGGAICAGMGTSYLLTPKPYLPGATGKIHASHAWALSIAAVLTALAPYIMRSLFPYSGEWGPEWGPRYTLGPVYFIQYLIGYVMAGGMDFMAVTRVGFAFFFTGVHVINHAMTILEAYARENFNVLTCDSFFLIASLLALWGIFEGLFLPYMYKDQLVPLPPPSETGAPVGAAPTAPVVIKEKKVETPKMGAKGKKGDDKKAVEEKEDATVTTATAVVAREKYGFSQFNWLHLGLAALTAGAVFYTEAGGVKQCLPGGPPAKPDYNAPYIVLDRADSKTGYVTVFEDPTQFGGVRMMRCDHSVLGGVFTSHYNNSVYGSFYFLEFVRYIERKQQVEKPRALQIGLGIGVTAKTLTSAGVSVDIVELDPAVYEFAQKYFDCPPGDSHYIGDGRFYVDHVANDSSYDWVLHDVFTGGVVPGNLFTLEAMRSVRRVLKEDGVLAMNFVGQLDSNSTEAVVNTLKAVFTHIVAYRELPPASAPPERITNLVFYASNAPIKFRAPTQKDLRSGPPGNMYPKMWENFASYRVKDADIKGMVEVEEELEEGAVAKNKTMIRDGFNPLGGMQVDNARIHWEIMRELFKGEMWEEV
ncbi:hypothetical protein HDV00_010177 [Rhizophlyctis rosea]|nr:hypothetical protein HDV00_010177 [Rhizophlyctis rosea]